MASAKKGTATKVGGRTKASKQLSRETFEAIIKKAQAGAGPSLVMKETGESSTVVRKTMCAFGFLKTRPEVEQKDREIVLRWLESAGWQPTDAAVAKIRQSAKDLKASKTKKAGPAKAPAEVDESTKAAIARATALSRKVAIRKAEGEG